MQDLAMITLELVQNSIRANASRLDLRFEMNQENGWSSLIIQDNGEGMDAETLKKVSSPFFTSRTTRKIGLGLSFFQQAITQAGGACDIRSTPQVGTTVIGRWRSDHWDAPPLGNLGELVLLALQGRPDLHVCFSFKCRSKTYEFDSKVLESSLAPVPITEPAVLLWIENEINTNIQHCKGGIDHEES